MTVSGQFQLAVDSPEAVHALRSADRALPGPGRPSGARGPPSCARSTGQDDRRGGPLASRTRRGAYDRPTASDTTTGPIY